MGALIYIIIANFITGIILLKTVVKFSKQEVVLAILMGWLVLPVGIVGYLYSLIKRVLHK